MSPYHHHYPISVSSSSLPHLSVIVIITFPQAMSIVALMHVSSEIVQGTSGAVTTLPQGGTVTIFASTMVEQIVEHRWSRHT